MMKDEEEMGRVSNVHSSKNISVRPIESPATNQRHRMCPAMLGHWSKDVEQQQLGLS